MSVLRATDITCKTDTGRQRRDNEDSAFARAPLFVVADGMGGAQAGEVASQTAIEVFGQALPDDGAVEERLAERVREANRVIYARAHAEREHAGMGTTVTAAYLESDSLVIAHVGDSRAYLMRDGALKRLTRDHSLVAELVERGKLTEEQAAEHPQRSIITRALGPEAEVEVDTWTYPVRDGDVLLLCSDGLTSMLSEDEVGTILAEAGSLERAGDELIAAANAAGGRDNITVVLFRVQEAGNAAGEDGATLTGLSAPETGRATAARGPGAPAPGAGAGTAEVARPVARVDSPASSEPRTAPRRRRRATKLVAALTALVVVLGLVLGGGYLATRQLYFIGTNAQGVVTIYRGLPYSLPAGLRLYETFYVSGVPATLVPATRRSSLLDNRLRSEKDAASLVRDLELGRISQ